MLKEQLKKHEIETNSHETITLNVVDFPAPLTPSKPKHSPFLRPKDNLSVAGFFCPL
jgi:hypothetical protein